MIKGLRTIAARRSLTDHPGCTAPTPATTLQRALASDRIPMYECKTSVKGSFILPVVVDGCCGILALRATVQDGAWAWPSQTGRKGKNSMLRKLILSTAVAGVASALGGAAPAFAQDVGIFGDGPSRICNTVIELLGPVGPEDRVRWARAPEPDLRLPRAGGPAQVAVIEPAAPPPEPLPDSGVVYFDFDRAELNPSAELTPSPRSSPTSRIASSAASPSAGMPTPPVRQGLQHASSRSGARTRSRPKLIKAGIPVPTIVTTEAFGETELAVETPDGTPAQPNRRATIDFQR